jgi:hypothetical protein
MSTVVLLDIVITADCVTERLGVVVLLPRVREVKGSSPGPGAPDCLYGGFRCFPQSLQTNCWYIGHNHFHIVPINYSQLLRHAMLCNLLITS